MHGNVALQVSRLTKRFPGTVALDGVTLTVRQGSCHGLVGENGAGKSTLGKVLAGIHQPDVGELTIFGQRRNFRHPAEALAAGIALVHQELSFCENMTVAENLLLGQLPRRGPFLSQQEVWAQARRLLNDIAPELDVTLQLGALPVSQQQLVQIAAAIGRGVRLIIFDEPTSSLSDHETARLHALIRQLLTRGVTCLYISHRLSEIFSLCDTISVLRDGQLVHSGPRDALDEDAVINLMIGRQLGQYFPRHVEQPPREVLLEVQHLTSPGRFRDVSFTVRAGEIVGLAGLVGAGRTEVAEAIFGLDPVATGNVRVGDVRVRQARVGHSHVGQPSRLTGPARRLPRAMIAAGLGLVPEDRKRHGLVPAMSVADNLALPIMGRLAKCGWLNRRRLWDLTRRYLERLRVRAPGPGATVSALSGGNQQKVILSRWLAADCRVLILDEPTRGVDVGAKAEIHALIDELAAQGLGVLLISSELPELLHLCTRLLVMRAGRVVAELQRDELNQERVLRLMGGWAA